MPSKCLFTFFLAFALAGRVFAADNLAPVTSHTLTPTSPDGKNGWYVSSVKVDLQATDLDSGIKRMHYRVDNGIWQTFMFDNNLNLAPNPSFEDDDTSWTGAFSFDSVIFEPSFPTRSAKITSTETGWHSINHSSHFAVAAPLGNMSAAVSLKTENVTEAAYYKVYAISTDLTGQQYTTLLTQSSTLTGTVDWTRIYLNFVVSVPNAIGVYLEIGMDGPGTVWADAVSLSASTKSAAANFTVAKDSESHLVEYYSVDFAGNIEPTKSFTFKQDMTPPNNWHESGAFRSVTGPSDHHLYVYTNVDDETSGLSTTTSKYQYFTDLNPDFGTFSDLQQCSSGWVSGNWANLSNSVDTNGEKTAYLLTPKTDFCNDNWKICKTVKFFAEDMAGNISYKDMCINGPWIKLRGGGTIRSNYIIDMVAESDEPNTDGLIETGGNSVNFFYSMYNWKAKLSPIPATKTYEQYKLMVTGPTTIAQLPVTSGKFIYEGNMSLASNNIPVTYDSATFNQIILVNGDLTIESNLEINNNSTVLFIVKGNVNISDNVTVLQTSIITDGTLSTAYDSSEGKISKTLQLYGFYNAHKFNFQRTLQGTNNTDTPSEDFVYEPKYLIQLKTLFGESTVKWLSIE